MGRFFLLSILAFTAVFSLAPVHVIADEEIPLSRPPDQNSPKSSELALFNLTNDDRVKYGVPPLQFDLDLLLAARARSAAQRSDSSLSHYDGNGQLAFLNLIGSLDIDYARAGENLARVPAPPTSAPDRAEEALMDSPTHRANILQPEYNRIAIGQVVDRSGRIVFAELFRAVR